MVYGTALADCVCDTALGECDVRPYPDGMWCTMLRWRRVVYDAASWQCGVRCCHGRAIVYNTILHQRNDTASVIQMPKSILFENERNVFEVFVYLSMQ